MTINNITFLVAVFFLPIWFVWEMFVIWLASKGYVGGEMAGRVSTGVATISQVMQRRAYQMNALPFFWCSMVAHWWWNWFSGKTWESALPAITFWVMVTATLALDVYLWKTPYNTLHSVLKFYRAPMIQCVLGFAAGYILFPQAMVRLQGWRWW